MFFDEDTKSSSAYTFLNSCLCHLLEFFYENGKGKVDFKELIFSHFDLVSLSFADSFVDDENREVYEIIQILISCLCLLQKFLTRTGTGRWTSKSSSRGSHSSASRGTRTLNLGKYLSVAEPLQFYAAPAPAPGQNSDAAPAPQH
jgi:hypothetical protein